MSHSFYFVLYASTIVFFSSCNVTKSNNSSNTGLFQGTVSFSEGNQMQSNKYTSVLGKGVQREVHIYELTNVKDVEQIDNLYFSPKSKIVAIIVSNTRGEFKQSLPPGTYSVLIKEGDGYFASFLDKENNLHPLQINTGETTTADILINYKVSY